MGNFVPNPLENDVNLHKITCLLVVSLERIRIIQKTILLVLLIIVHLTPGVHTAGVFPPFYIS